MIRLDLTYLKGDNKVSNSFAMSDFIPRFYWDNYDNKFIKNNITRPVL